MIYRALYRMSREIGQQRRAWNRVRAWTLLALAGIAFIATLATLAAHYLFGLQIMAKGGPLVGRPLLNSMGVMLALCLLGVVGGLLWLNHLDTERD